MAWRPDPGDLAVAVQGVLTENGIEIPLPQRDLRVRNVGAIKDALDEVLGRAPGDRSS